MAEKLTQQQACAVKDRGGRLLVSAAAGSGKTKVLVDRLLSYIMDPVNPANIDDFLIITYTKAAASELRGKIADKLSERIAEAPENRHLQRQMQRLYLAKISTVHSYCADILREYAHILDIPGNFRVAEESECLELQIKAAEDILEDAYRSINQDSAFRAFIETLGVGRNDARVPQLLFDVYGRAMCHLDPAGWMDQCLKHYRLTDATDISETIWGKYLLDDFHAYLQEQTKALSACADAARVAIGFEKVALRLDETIDQLVALDHCATWDQFIEHIHIDYGTLTFPRKCSNPELAEQIKAVRNACKKGLEKRLRRFSCAGEQAFCELRDSAIVVEGMFKLVMAFSNRYATLKSGRNILDFTDLEHKTLDLLIGKGRYGPTSVAMEIGECFREVMVDEYQDSNAVQDAIYCALTNKRQNCFMVGDVKQSIYQFRLADPTIFLEKYHAFPSAENAEDGRGRKVLLSRNFRSSGGVIDAVNDVFTLCMSPQIGGLYYGDEERLYEGIPHVPLGEKEAELYCVDVQEDTYLEEAAFVARRIDELLSTGAKVREDNELRTIRPSDIVILLRSPGSVGGEFQSALEARGIRCSMGNQTDLLQTEEIQVLISILQIISNPIQDIPLLGAMTSRVFCFTADDVAQIRSIQRWGDFYSALRKCEEQKAMDFLGIVDHLRKQARVSSLPKLIEHIFLATKITSIYASLSDGNVRSENLQQFYQLACNYAVTGQGNLDAFLHHLQALQQRGLVLSDDTVSDDAVRIMSIHKSKGLEFPVVFLAGLSKDFNQEDSRGQVLCDRVLGVGISNTDSVTRVRYPTVAKNAIARKMISDSISEELRVLYVAMTRARDRLIMTYASRKMQEYLDELKMRLVFSDPQLLSMDTMCAGDWVLMTAVMGQANTGYKNLYPWSIQLVHAQPENLTHCVIVEEQQVKNELPLEKIQNSLKYRYPHNAATTAPSKQTATQIKGRIKDREISEHTATPAMRHLGWRSPSFACDEIKATEIGQIVHTVMQRIRFQDCTGLDGVQKELKRLSLEGFVSSDMLAHIDAQSIYAFFETDIGRRIRDGKNVLREFKFSLLEDADVYFDGLNEEQILLQGVVDCALLQEDGITVIDFKTDKVTEKTLEQRVVDYTEQINTYARALERIYQLPVKEKVLYFFQLSKVVTID